MLYNEKLVNRILAVTTAAKLFCQVQRLTVTATRENVFLSPAHHDLSKKTEFDSMNISSEAGLARPAQDRLLLPFPHSQVLRLFCFVLPGQSFWRRLLHICN